jgi:DNA-directed RNA polymerase specialized sigma24 family protein
VEPHPALAACLEPLSPGERAVFTLCELLHWELTDAAELLGIPVEAATDVLLRAQAKTVDKP